MIKFRSLLSESANKYIGYHGTNVKFRRFSLNMSTQGIIWFTSNKQEIMDGNVGAAGRGYIITAELTIKNPAGWEEYDRYSIGELKGLRYDGVILDNTENDDKDYIIFSTSQIKILKTEKIDKMNINEGFDLPKDMDEQTEKLAQFIASFYLPFFERRIKNAKTKSDKDVVKYNEYYRLAKQYREQGKSLFKVEKKVVKGHRWGDTSIVIISKNDVLPPVHLRMTNAYVLSNDGYVTGSTEENVPEVFMMVDQHHFVTKFKKSLEETTDTLKHEIRHYIQFANPFKNAYGGFPKRKLKSKKADAHGNINIRGYSAREKHHMRDIEFKTNVHTYAFYIKRLLNKRFPRNKWVDKFKEIVTGKITGVSIDGMDMLIDNLEHMMKTDRPRWIQFVKEIYREILK